MSTPTHARGTRRPDAVALGLDELELITRLDPTVPVPDDPSDLALTSLDEPGSRASVASRYGFLTVEETLDEVAASMGREPELPDPDELYER